MSKWTRVDSSMGENLELPENASMRLIKEKLSITGKRCILESQGGAIRTYRMVGTTYTFTVTECY